MVVSEIYESEVAIPSGRHVLAGQLRIPPNATGVVLFAHGSGSGRFSPRNQFVARQLEAGGLATLLLDLLEEDESEDRELVFDIDLLAERLTSASEWLVQQPQTRTLAQGYFGASTGAAAALTAAARHPQVVRAVVSRGGRPDLAQKNLSSVQAPTLLLVGGYDDPVVELNEQAFRQLGCRKQLIIVPGATHLFEEPGTLEDVAQLACKWFVHYLSEQPDPQEINQQFGERFPRADMDEQC
jgi:putative phosphoribosyl transferase